MSERAGKHHATRENHHEKHDEFRRTITINRPLDVVQQFWSEHGGTADERVRFIAAPGNRGTEVHLSRTYPSPGPIATVIKVARHTHPDQQLRDELGAFKAILETGDIVLSDAWVNGPNEKHPSQPDANASASKAHQNNLPEANA